MTTATKKKQTNGAVAKSRQVIRAPASRPIAAKPVSDPPQPIETDVAHERRPLGSVWREPRANIRRSATNPRTVFELDELIATLKSQGQLVPIIVRFRPDTDSGTDYEIIDGESRDRAFEILGWTDIEVKLVEMTDEQVEEVQLVTTLSRADLKPLDEAHAYERLERKGYSVDQIADRVGKTRGHIRMRVALARLTDEAKAALRDGAISVGAAQELAAVTDPAAQRNVVARALEGRAPGADPMTAKQIRMFVEQAMLVLSRAKFALDDATLHPTAGACNECPKRSSQQFALIALTGGGDDERCTDRSCFTTKQEAYWSRESERARAAGLTVIEGDAARKVIAFGGIAKESGYVGLDDHCAELRDGRTWREVLGDDALPVSLVRGADGASHRIVPKADAVRLLRERGLLRAPGAPAQAPTTAAPAPAQPANDAAPDTAPTSEERETEPELLTVEQIARAAKRTKLDADTFAAIAEALIVAIEPADTETQAIVKPYDAPVPPDAEGHDVVIDIWRGLATDGERIALLARVACAISQKARARLSARFADAAAPKKRGRAAIAATAPAVEPQTDADATADGEPDGYAASEVDQSIRDNVQDLLRSHALQRSDLATQLADIEGMTESDADSEIEQLLREGRLLDNGERIEWVADRATSAPEQTSLFTDAPRADDAPRAVF